MGVPEESRNKKRVMEYYLGGGGLRVLQRSGIVKIKIYNFSFHFIGHLSTDVDFQTRI